jgi:hypothetical protein
MRSHLDLAKELILSGFGNLSDNGAPAREE